MKSSAYPARRCAVTIVINAGIIATSLVGRVASAQTDATAQSVTTDFTNVTSAVYNSDNRNSRSGDVSRELDDDWGVVYNRLNAQANTGNWRFSARVDGAWFYTSRGPADVGLALLEQRRPANSADSFSKQDADFFVNKYFEAGAERNTRFTDWLYPSKFSVTYATSDYEVVVGDFYAQLGRGLVLSVRKQDELSSDTTLRGVRLGAQTRLEDVRVKFTAMGGNLNPLRLDGSSGRFLGVSSAHLSTLDEATEFGMPRVVGSDFVEHPLPTYVPDSVFGGELELRTGLGTLSFQGARFDRGCIDVSGSGPCQTLSSDLSRSSPRITQGGLAAEVPDLWQHGALYVEYAYQALERSQSGANHPGHALYSALSITAPPFSATIEAKHVRGYQTVSAGIDTGRAPEFSPVVYNIIPTTEPVWNDTQFENFGACVTGGRARADVELAERTGLFAWLGHYQTFGELGPAECAPESGNKNTVWDVAQGVETSFDAGKSNANFLVGSRFDYADERLQTNSGETTHVFYRELYLRYDVVQWIGGDNAIQLQGWHRRRRQSLGGPETPWLQGMTTTAFQLGRTWNFALGIEYDQNPAFPNTYLNGQVRYNLSPSNNVTLFIGQQQGGLRCVSGVCRVFPPFEGARLDATMRF